VGAVGGWREESRWKPRLEKVANSVKLTLPCFLLPPNREYRGERECRCDHGRIPPLQGSTSYTGIECQPPLFLKSCLVNFWKLFWAKNG
jgi:hypothetical protein